MPKHSCLTAAGFVVTNNSITEGGQRLCRQARWSGKVVVMIWWNRRDGCLAASGHSSSRNRTISKEILLFMQARCKQEDWLSIEAAPGTFCLICFCGPTNERERDAQYCSKAFTRTNASSLRITCFLSVWICSQLVLIFKRTSVGMQHDNIIQLAKLPAAWAL